MTKIHLPGLIQKEAFKEYCVFPGMKDPLLDLFRCSWRKPIPANTICSVQQVINVTSETRMRCTSIYYGGINTRSRRNNGLSWCLGKFTRYDFQVSSLYDLSDGVAASTDRSPQIRIRKPGDREE